MEENPPSHPGLPQESYAYQKLGPKTLMIFVLQRMMGPLILLVLSIILFIVRYTGLLAQIPNPDLPQYVNLFAWACLGLAILSFFVAFIISRLVYMNYKFALGENALKIKRGIFDQEEVAIPYRQIQDVDLVRPLIFRILKVSQIVILTAGHEDLQKTSDDEGRERGQSEGVLPILDKDLAEWMQAQLLDHANVQKVTEVKQ
jgi:uncharacterized membrane protein YdbT with pleckstrin-like domain